MAVEIDWEKRFADQEERNRVAIEERDEARRVELERRKKVQEEAEKS